MKVLPYDRQSAFEYAKLWAYKRNDAYYNFDLIGGDCTNFVSQCILAGAPVMNFKKTFGWYYNSINDRSPSWTGVEYLYNFLISNEGVGPFAQQVELKDLGVGDIVQLGRPTGEFYHTPIVTGFLNGQPLVSAHTYDTFNKPLFSFNFAQIRYVKLLGYRDY